MANSCSRVELGCFVLGDSIDLQCTLSDVDITNWKIRAELYDKSEHSVKKANTASGGDDTQVEITDGTNGKFTVYIAKDETSDFKTKSYFEIEGESPEGKLYTIYQANVSFQEGQITWQTPTS